MEQKKNWNETNIGFVSTASRGIISISTSVVPVTGRDSYFHTSVVPLTAGGGGGGGESCPFPQTVFSIAGRTVNYNYDMCVRRVDF